MCSHPGQSSPCPNFRRSSGGLELVNSFSLLPFKLPVFEILLIVAGAILLASGLRDPRLALFAKLLNS